MSGKKAVVCDDDTTMQRIVQRILEKQGFEVRAASNGQDGLGLVRAEKPNLLVLDLDMPVKGGLDVLRDLRREGGQGPYVIVLSNHEGREEQSQVKGLGAQDVMIKPFNPADFVTKIQGLVKGGLI